MFSNSLDIFVYYLMAPIIFTLGLTGNILGFKVLERKKMEQIGPLFIYRCMFVIDTMFLMSIFIFYFDKAFSLSFFLISDLCCKLFFFMANSVKVYCPMILIYISMDRFISLKYYSKRKLFKQKKYQLLYLIGFVSFNFVYYMPVLFYYEINVDSQNISVCTYAGASSIFVVYMDLVFSYLAFLVILTFSFLLIHKIFASRKRISSNQQSVPANAMKNHKKDIRLAVTSISLNLFYLLLYSPMMIVYYFFPDIYVRTYAALMYVFFTISASDFYILVLTNRLFRNEFIGFVRNESQAPNNNYNYNNTNKQSKATKINSQKLQTNI